MTLPTEHTHKQTGLLDEDPQALDARMIQRTADVFFLPIITYPRGEGYVDEKHKTEVRLHRLIALSESTTGLVPLYEAFLYLHTASLITPFNSTWHKIYKYLFFKLHRVEAQQLDMSIESLNDYELSLITELRRAMYKDQVKYLTEKRRKQHSSQHQESTKITTIIQKKLF